MVLPILAAIGRGAAMAGRAIGRGISSAGRSVGRAFKKTPKKGKPSSATRAASGETKNAVNTSQYLQNTIGDIENQEEILKKVEQKVFGEKNPFQNEIKTKEATSQENPKMQRPSENTGTNPPQQEPPRDYPPQQYYPQQQPEYYQPPRRNSPVKRAFNFTFKKVPDHIEIQGANYLVLLVIIVHIADIAWLRLNTTDQYALFMRGILNLLIVFVANRVLKEYGKIEELIKIWGVVVVVIPGIGWLLRLFGTQEQLTLYMGALLLFPFWLYYLTKVKHIQSPNTTIANLGSIYITTLIFIGIIYIIAVATQFLTATPIVEGQEEWFSPDEALRGAGQLLGGAFSNIVDSIKNIGSGVGNATERMLNQSLGHYYTGRVEENTERTGVFIDGFSTRENFYEGFPVVVSGTLTARSFVEEVNLTLTCSATDRQGNISFGTAEPEEMTVFEEDRRVVFCRFDDLPAGNYEIMLTAQFNFETWAYTTYTFISREYLTSLRAGGEDIHRKLGIDRRPTTIYTSGPVTLGMSQNIELPLGVSSETDSSVPIGITLDNRYMGAGNIERVEKLQIKVPDYFRLIEGQRNLCTREITDESPGEVEGYTSYTFENPSPELVQTYLSVGCNMLLPRDNALGLLGGNLQSTTDVTVVGVASYEYMLRSRTNVRVQEDPAAPVEANDE